MKFISLLVLFVTIIFSSTYAEDQLSKKATVFVSLSPAGSFEISTSRFKGGKIKKSGNTYSVSEIYVPTEKLTSGIDLRDEHIRDRIKNETVMVKSATGKNGQGKGIIVIRDIAKEFSFSFEALSGNFIKAKFSLNLSDFKIPNLSYMGVGVENEIKLEVVLPVD